MSSSYTDGPESPDTSREVPKAYTPNPSTAPNVADSATTGQNRSEYTDGPEPTQDEM